MGGLAFFLKADETNENPIPEAPKIKKPCRLATAGFLRIWGG